MNKIASCSQMKGQFAETHFMSGMNGSAWKSGPIQTRSPQKYGSIKRCFGGVLKHLTKSSKISDLVVVQVCNTCICYK